MWYLDVLVFETHQYIFSIETTNKAWRRSSTVYK